MSLYQIIIAACAILSVMAIYRVRITSDHFASAAIGGAAVLVACLVLIIIGIIAS